MKNTAILVALCLGLAVTSPAMGGLRVFPNDGTAVIPVIPEPTQNLDYVVKSGDTLGAIAQKNKVALKDLMQANKITDAKKLKVGQKLVIPGVAPAKAAPAKAAPAQAAKPGQQTATQAAAAPVAAKPAAPAEKSPEPAKKDAKAEAKDAKVEAKDAKAEAKEAKGKGKGKGASEPEIAAAPVAATPPSKAAYGKTGVIENNTDVPRAIREEFNEYGKKWLIVSEELAVGTPNNKKVRQVGGQWEASYRIIHKETMGTEVKRVEYEHTPYVGHLTYAVTAYISTGPTKDAALKGPYQEKEEHIREIFSYDGKKKAWR